MRRLSLLAAVLAFVLLGGTAVAEQALQAELAKLYQRYNDLVAADKLDEAMALRTDEVQADLKEELAKGTPQEQAEMREMLKGMTPSAFEAQHLELNGDDEAVLFGIGSKVMPFGPDAGKLKLIEMQVEFFREAGAWRIGMPTFLGDPDEVKRPDEVGWEPIENYDQDRELEMGGRIVRVALEADHTLVVVRMLDEEQALYLPDQKFLKEQGFDVGLLKPYVIVEASGHPHKSNPFKVWVTGLTVQ